MAEFFRNSDYWILPEITTHLGFLLALVFLAYLIQQKRSPASTMAWLLLVLFLPYVGVPLYLMLGGRKMIRMARKKAQVYDRTQPPLPSQFDSDTERFLLSYGVRPPLMVTRWSCLLAARKLSVGSTRSSNRRPRRSTSPPTYSVL